MAKKKITAPKREVTKRQATRWQQESRRHRIVLITGLVVIVGVLITVGYGWFFNEYRPMHETMITVNDTSFDMGYYINDLKIASKDQPPEYIYTIASNLPMVIERDELIRQAAAGLGYTISDDEVNAQLAKQGLNKDYFDAMRSDLLVQKLLNDYFGPKIPDTGEQRQILAMFLESKQVADEVSAQLDSGASFADLAKQFSVEATTQQNGGDLGWHVKGILTDNLGTNIVDEYAFGSGKDTLSPPMLDSDSVKSVGYWLIKVIELKPDGSQAHIQAMLLGSQEEAQSVKDRLDNGEDFATLAKQYSQSTVGQDNGGDMGWLAPDSMTKPMSDFAFNASTEIGKVSDPIKDTTVQTKGGYWLIKAADIDANRTISTEDKNHLETKSLNDWITGLFTDSNNKIDDSALTSEKIAFAVLKASQT